MQTLYSYSYNPVVATASQYITTQYRMAYKSPLILFKGMNNTFKLVIMNNSQKLVDLTNYAVEIRIIDLTTNEYVVNKTVNFDQLTPGTMTFTLLSDDLSVLDGLFYNMSAILKQIDGESFINPEILYIDDNYGALLPVHVKDGLNATPISSP